MEIYGPMKNAIGNFDLSVIEAGGITWYVNPRAEEIFSEWARKYWPQAMSEPERWLKRGTKSLTGMTAGFVFKAYLPSRKLTRHISRLRQSKAQKAFQAACRLHGQGAGIPTPIAWSDDRRLGTRVHAVLVTEYIPEARPLAPVLIDREEPPPELFERLGALLGVFHANNYCNRDFKDTNILLAGSASAPAPLSIDLDGVRRMPPLPDMFRRKMMLRDFIPLLLSIAVHGRDRPEIRRGIAAGWSSITGMPLASSELPPITKAQTPFASYAGIEIRLNRRRLRRQTVAIHAPVLRPPCLLYAYHHWRSRLPGLDLVSSSKTGTLFRGKLPGQAGLYYFKRYEINSVLSFVRHLVRPLPALRACRGARLLSAVGLKTPPIMAAIESRVNGLPRTSELVAEAVSNAHSLDQFFAEGYCDAYPRATRRQISRNIGAAIGRLHKSGLVHGDLRPDNLLARMDADHPEIELVFTENERTHPCRHLHARVRDLVQLNMLPPDLMPMSDRFRFWRAYRQACALDSGEARRLLRRVAVCSRKRWHRRGWL